ncbi:MAG: hypothetical protein ACK40O_04545 [Allosphingosinicella sp.]
MAARKGTPLLEWIAAGLGALITLCLLGFIAWEALVGTHSGPAAVSLEATRLHRSPTGFTVDVTARNRTDSTAAAVHIEGALGPPGAAVETSQATLSYVPGQSERKAALLFRNDPRRHGLTLRVTGYEKP